MLTETASLSLSIGVLTGSCGGAMSASWGEWLFVAAPSSAAAAAAAAPTAPSVTADRTARRTGRALRRTADDRTAGCLSPDDPAADPAPNDDD